MQHYIDVVQDRSGNVIGGAIVVITDNSTGLPVTVYSDAGGSIVKPTVTTDTAGTFDFYVPGGRYNFLVTKNGTTLKTVTDVDIVDYQDYTVSIKKFGAIGDGIADDTAAIQAALTYAVANNVPIFFQHGKYKITGNITVNFPSYTSVLIITGAGSSVSKIISPNGCGIIINFIGPYNSIQVSGLTVLGGLTNTGTAFLIAQTGSVGNPCDCATSLFYDVTIAGTSTNTFFQTGISITGASCFNFKSVSIYGDTTSGFVGINCGYGIILQGNGAGQPIPVQFNIESCTLNNLTVGIYYGNYVQGVAVSLTNFTQCNWGILAPTAAQKLDQLSVMGCQFNCASRGILLQNILVNTMISNNLFLIPDGVIGIDIIYATCLSITGNTFNYESTGASTTGIAIESTFNGSITPNKSTDIIAANAFLGLGVGVWLWAGCVGLKCFGNVFGQMLTADVVDAGTRSILGKPVGLTSSNFGTNTTISASVSFTPVTTGTLKITGVVNYQDLGTTNYTSTLTVAGVAVQQCSSKMSTSHTWCVAVVAGTAITSTITGQSAGAFTVEISMLFVPDI